MTEFTRSIFKLNYTTPAFGSCTTNLVPNFVDVDCLPSTSLKVDSETMHTVEHVHSSISNKVKVSVGAKYKGVAFSYSFSTETRKMLDNIVRNHQTSIHTSAEISYIKLSMFEPLMKLSDNFRYVIENMPCCDENDSDTVEYVKDFIFEYFGFAYIDNLLLGGVAHQSIFITREGKERLESNGISIVHEAKVSFGKAMGTGAELGTNVETIQNTSNYNSFMEETISTHTNTMGGTTHLVSLAEWSKTVVANPVIIKFEIRDIFRILTSRNFPNDPLIADKSKSIGKILEQYLSHSVYCYKNCGNNGTRGTCEPTGYFNFGLCKCKPEWTGVDCETPAVTDKKILHGTICGFDRSFMKITCDGAIPWKKCPSNWVQYNWRTDLTVCYKNQTETGTPVFGTLCGLNSYHPKYNFDLYIGCNVSFNVLHDKCPPEYRQTIATTGYCSPSGLSSLQRCTRNAMCIALNPKENLSGTLCGMQIQDTKDGPSCDGYDPGLGRCPSDHNLHRTAFNDYGFMMIAYPDTNQFHDVIESIRKYPYRYKIEQGKIYPKLKFIGTVKLHGTNTAIVYQKDVEYHCQSRHLIISPEMDNLGFARFMYLLSEKFLQECILVNCSLLRRHDDRGNTIIRIGDSKPPVWIDPKHWSTLQWHEQSIYNIFNFPTYEVDIDFNQLELAQKQLGEITNTVEQECPVGMYFNQKGYMEKVLFGLNGGSLAPIATEIFHSIHEFIEYACTENRMNQSMDYLREIQLEIEMDNIDTFLEWLIGDIKKEETNTIKNSDLNLREVISAITKKATAWFEQQLLRNNVQ
ncbi:hypothetical protein I4U23_022726 [Adineta vaga]|nr:hypothetical protein I4U23_022726 [Adineta vaga]